VTTVLRKASQHDTVMTFLDREVGKGRQGYIVYPIIEVSDKLALKAATTMYEELSSGILKERRLALLHGRIPADERDALMRRFRDGGIDVLVATTVIEVGIDVANATVMVIEHPERFGLSQLHQLRGRVGRGAEESYCILIGGGSPDTMARLRLFAGTDDGFEIARADLRLRGMGDLFGERQSGLPMFRVADPVEDEALNTQAREDAAVVIERDPQLQQPGHAALRRVLSSRYARAMELFRVG
jgi:ATP-dependent DNA helicase RecG